MFVCVNVNVPRMFSHPLQIVQIVAEDWSREFREDLHSCFARLMWLHVVPHWCVCFLLAVGWPKVSSVKLCLDFFFEATNEISLIPRHWHLASDTQNEEVCWNISHSHCSHFFSSRAPCSCLTRLISCVCIIEIPIMFCYEYVYIKTMSVKSNYCTNTNTTR